MSNKNAYLRSRSSRQRAWVGLAGVLGLGWGAVTLAAGKLRSPKYWLAPVFTPFAIVVGSLVLIVPILIRGLQR